jgi:uncharacterized repeat protein (TIGR03803 family)
VIGARKKRTSAYVLIACIIVMSAGHATAQYLSPLHSLNNTNDGRYANNELVLSDNTLYGTAQVGGNFDRGTIFSISTVGTGLTIIHHFSATADPPYTNTDGAYPEAGLIASGNTLYGTTSQGGSSVVGTVFRVNTDGTGYTNLHNFMSLPYSYPISTNDEGAYPAGRLALSGDTLYGTTPRGGTLGNGTVFAVRIDGDGFTNLHNFTPSEGYNSRGGLILSGDTLYGATYDSTPGSGTVFKLNTNGADFTVLHRFADIPNYPSPSTNSDGRGPFGGLILSSNTLYGTTTSGGKGYGSVFAVHTGGTGFTNLHFFNAADGNAHTNGGGAFPWGRLTLIGNSLVGSTSGSENFGPGTVFAINTDGSGFTTLHNFPLGTPAPINLNLNGDGDMPRTGLLQSGFNLYGTTEQGGDFGYGTIYRLSLLPEITLTVSETNVVLTWPVQNVGFTTTFNLESSSNLDSQTAWRPVLPTPKVVNGLNIVTNLISGDQMFYRLRQ